MKKIKRLIASVGTTIVLLTGCSSMGSIDFTQYAVKQMGITSMESKSVTSINLKYDEKKVKDKETLKLLKLFSDIKITAHMVIENEDTMSIAGKMTIKKGEIPFKLFSKSEEVILQLDNASKPIRIVDSTSVSNENYIATLKKLTPYIVKHLPNPSTLEVTSKQDKVQNEYISGKNIHMEMYGDEIPFLILSFMEGISKDKEAIQVLVSAINEADDSVKLTTQSFKKELDTMVAICKEQLTMVKQDKTLQQFFSKNNYIKANILVDNQLYERRSDIAFHFLFPTSDENGIKSLNIATKTENWNINQPTNAQKIPATQYITEEQMAVDENGEVFLNTLHKGNSVLYDILVNDL